MKPSTVMSSSSGLDIKEVFTYFDKDRDGFLQGQDIGTALRSYGLCPSQMDVKQMIAKSGDRIDLSTFTKLAQSFSQSKRNNAEEIREALRIFDKRGTGMIDMFEMKHAMTSLGEKLKAEEVDELIRAADVDGDGNARFEDVVRILSTNK
ncbi:hypothetical protein ACOME3_001677 [Neoechinorhynchus agilis]